MAHVAIAYNTGRFRPALALVSKDFKGDDGRFYGETIFDFIRLSRTVPVPGGVAPILPPAPGNAIVPPPTAVAVLRPAGGHDARSPLVYGASPASAGRPAGM